MARLLSEFYGTTKGSISAAAVSHNVIGRPAKKKKKKKGFFCLLPLSFIISYKIFLEQRSDNNFFLCASTKKGNESLVFSWNLGRRRRGKNLTDTLEIGVYDGHFPVNAFLPSCPDILPPPLKASVEEATLETGLHP